MGAENHSEVNVMFHKGLIFINHSKSQDSGYEICGIDYEEVDKNWKICHPDFKVEDVRDSEAGGCAPLASNSCLLASVVLRGLLLCLDKIEEDKEFAAQVAEEARLFRVRELNLSLVEKCEELEYKKSMLKAGEEVGFGNMLTQAEIKELNKEIAYLKNSVSKLENKKN